jgi:hypothetical protein
MLHASRHPPCPLGTDRTPDVRFESSKVTLRATSARSLMMRWRRGEPARHQCPMHPDSEGEISLHLDAICSNGPAPRSLSTKAVSRRELKRLRPFLPHFLLGSAKPATSASNVGRTFVPRGCVVRPEWRSHDPESARFFVVIRLRARGPRATEVSGSISGFSEWARCRPGHVRTG